MHARGARGSALFVAIVVILVVSMIGVSLVRLTSRELAGATAARHAAALTSCAEAGRLLLVGQFRAAGLAPTSITALNVPLDAASGGVTVMGGHVDQPLAGVQVSQVKLLPAGTFNVNRGRSTGDLSNVIGALGNLGEGAPYRVVVRCVDRGAPDGTGGRQLEIEFGVQFGI